MRLESILVLFALMISISASAITRTTITDGSFSDENIWDCTCVPMDDDSVVVTTQVISNVDRIVSRTTVTNGGKLTVSGGIFRSFGDLEIQLGGEVNNTTRLIVVGDYLFFGTHSGNGNLDFSLGGTLYGNGSFLKTGFVRFYNGIYFIDAGAELDFGSSRVALKNSSRIQNFGSVTVLKIEGTSANFFINRTGSTLKVRDLITPAVRLRAHAVNNIVVYNKTGSTNQRVGKTDLGYFNLKFKGSSIASVKKLTANIVVLNDLTIEDSTLDPISSSVVRNITVGGSWEIIGGSFTPRSTSVVTFTGLAETISSDSPGITFAKIVFLGNTILENQLVITEKLTLTGVLNADGNSIQIAGDWHSNGGTLVAGGGEVIFRGNTISNVTGSTDFDDVRISKSNGMDVNVLGQMRIFESLFLDFGNLVSNSTVVIGSNASRTGRLAKVTFGNFVGNLVVERYMNFPSNDWHLIGSSVTGTTLDSWNGDFITTGYPGSQYPGFYFNNITYYDESVAGHKDLGFVDVSSSTDAVGQGEGRRAYIAAGFNKLSVSGPPIIGPFVWNLSYNDYSDPDNDGWNLICNPYASTINWDDTLNWTRTGVKNAIYVWGGQDGSYSSYVGGIGTNGGTEYIPSSQAFWVQTETLPAVLAITENAKSLEDEIFRSQATQYFKIKMTTSNGFSDEVAVRAHEGATMAYDSNWDAYEFKSADQAYPSIGLTSDDEVDLSIYSLPIFGETTMIPMPIYTGSNGDVKFTMLGGADFPAKKCSIFDSQENVYYELIEDRDVTIFLEEGVHTERFYLVLLPLFENEATDVRSDFSAQNDYNVWLNNDQISIQNNAFQGQMANVTVLNSIGQILFQEKAVTLNGVKLIDAHRLSGLLIIQIDDLETGNQYIERLVK